MTVAQIAREMGRDLHPDRGAAFPDFAGHFLDVPDFADDAECLRVDEAIEELTALDGAILIQDRERHMLNVVIERVTERDHFDERREEHEEQRHRVAKDRDEFLEQDRVQAAKRRVFHAAFSCWFSPACLAVNVTKTSSNDGPISWISELAIPTPRSLSSISCRRTLSSTSRCIDCPNTVAFNTPFTSRIARKATVT